MSSLPIDIFISYAASDQESKEELEQYLDKLQQSGLIRFSSHQIPTDVDDEWGEQAHSDLDRFKIVLLLVSSYYISSEYFWDTFLPRIMQEHESSRVRIIPIILRPVDWLSAEFAKLQALPRFGKPIDRWENPSEAFEDVINGIQRVIEDLIESNSPARNPELPVKIFFSCAWKDLDEQAELQRHLILLERQGLVSFWHAGCISAGTERDIEIQNQLNAADIIIMLLSKHYLNSDYCFNNEFQRALERQRSENIRIVPILLENLVAIDQLLGKIPALPKNSKPINEWENKNEAFNNVASDIEGIVADFYKIPVKIYISYSHKDKAILNELQKYLSILVEKGIVTIWEDHMILPGSEWQQEIESNIRDADVILLLVTHNYLASDWCYHVDATKAMEQHESGRSRVIPIVMSPVSWLKAPFSKLQCLPPNGKPVTNWKNQEDAFQEIVLGIWEMIEPEGASEYKQSQHAREMIHTRVKDTKSKDMEDHDQNERNQVFVSYSHKDKTWLKRLQDTLKPLIRQQEILYWDDTKIKPGAKWRDEIQKALGSAKVAILLVSTHFLASDFIANEELPQLLQAAKAEGLTVLWVYVSACMYDEVAEIKEYQAAHDISRSLDSLSPAKRNVEFLRIGKAVKEAMGSDKSKNE